MRHVGFSTGALAKSDLSLGVEMARSLNLKAIELSALRLRELDTLRKVVSSQDFSNFDYVAIHAPTDFAESDEGEVSRVLGAIARRHQWPVVLHPDTIRIFDRWAFLGSLLYVENMDKRKPKGRTVEEVQEVITQLPKAQVCFDIAHARQVDSSMTEAYRLLRAFQDRIRQVHFSEVGSDSRHRRVSTGAFRAYGAVARSIPCDVPIILETVIPEGPNGLADAAGEIQRVSEFLDEAESLRIAAL